MTIVPLSSFKYYLKENLQIRQKKGKLVAAKAG